MIKLKYITRLIMCGVVSILLAFGFSVKGVNDIDMNTGQTGIVNKVRNELQFPNIVLEKVTDWNDKLGVDFTAQQWDGANWDTVIYKINSRYAGAISVLISKDALEYLFRNPISFLPTIVDYSDPVSSSKNFFIILTKIDNNNAKIEVCYSEQYLVSRVIFSTSKSSQGSIGIVPKWARSNSIYIYNKPAYSPNNGELLSYVPAEGDRLSIRYRLDSLPLLNPIMQNKHLYITAETEVRNLHMYPSPNGIEVNFSHFHYGKDSNTNDEYRMFFNGSVSYQFEYESNGIYRLNQLDNKLWIQIYKKSPTDLMYTMTHREEVFGTENLYINSIRLLP